MEVVGSLGSTSGAIEIKAEDIESDTENPPEEPRSKYPQVLKSHNQLSAASHSTRYTQDSIEEEAEFQYVCNIWNSAVEIVNISKNTCDFVNEDEGISKGISDIVQSQRANKVGPLSELIRNTNNQINQDSVTQDYEPYLHQRVYRKVADEEIFEEINMNQVDYGCVYCQYLSANRQHLINHIRLAHKDEGVSRRRKKKKQCPHCPSKPTNLEQHILSIHTKPEDIEWFQCTHCNHKTKYKLLLQSHITAKHTDPSLYTLMDCPECGKKFRKTAQLNFHIKYIHHPEAFERVQCYHCGFTAKRKSHLISHISRHNVTLADGFKCATCSFVGKYFNDLIRHRRKEHLRWLQCHLCPYRCVGATLFKRHLIHHQEKKKDEDMTYKCKKCDYKTYRSYNLTVHMLNHKKPEELEMFQCYHCGFKAKRKDNLKSHIFRHDVYKNILDCFICNFKTTSKYELNKHMDKHSEVQRKEAELRNAAGKKTRVERNKNKNHVKQKQVRSEKKK